MDITTMYSVHPECSNIKEIDFQDLVKAFLSSIDVSDSTRTRYTSYLTFFFRYLEENQIEQPRHEDILNYKNLLLKTKKPATVNLYLVPIRLFFSFTCDIHAYPNISTGIKKVKDKTGNKKKALSILQAKELMQTVLQEEKDPLFVMRDYCIINLMIRTGLREIEIVRLNIEDIDSEAGQTILYVWGKGRKTKDEFVVLTDDLYHILLEYLKLRKSTDETEPLFISASNQNKGERLTTRSIRMIVKNALIQAGLNSSKITTHSLRHTAVTLALLGGASLQDTQAMARHKNIQTTMVYAHNLNRFQNAAEKNIDAFFR